MFRENRDQLREVLWPWPVPRNPSKTQPRLINGNKSRILKGALSPSAWGARGGGVEQGFGNSHGQRDTRTQSKARPGVPPWVAPRGSAWSRKRSGASLSSEPCLLRWLREQLLLQLLPQKTGITGRLFLGKPAAARGWWEGEMGVKPLGSVGVRLFKPRGWSEGPVWCQSWGRGSSELKLQS